MTDSPHRGRDEQSGSGYGPNPAQPSDGGYQGQPDPAYASQAPYGPTYQTPSAPPPTEQLPYGYDPTQPASTTRTAAVSIRPTAPDNRRTSRSHPAGCGCWPRRRC